MLKYEDLTEEQKRRYNGLVYVIRCLNVEVLKQDLKGISEEDLLPIFTAVDKNGRTLLSFAITNIFNSVEEKVESILEVTEDSNILEEVLDRLRVHDLCILSRRILKNLEREYQYDECKKDKISSWKKIVEEKISSYQSNEKPLVLEKNRAVNKAMKVGSVCGIVAALAVGGGLFAAGAQLPILALIGIAAAVLTGLIAGSITYVISSKIENPDTSRLATEQGLPQPN